MRRRGTNTVNRLFALALVSLLTFGGCVYDPPPPYVAVPSRYDRSFDAALAAAGDVGVVVHSADRAMGRILGEKAGAEVTIELQHQADGTFKVEFNAPNVTETNPKLGERWLSAYRRRMGR
jgi:hypothetical protein